MKTKMILFYIMVPIAIATIIIAGLNSEGTDNIKSTSNIANYTIPTISDETASNATEQKKELARIEQFAYAVPGETNIRELFKACADIDYDDATGRITGTGIELILPTNHSNQIMFEIFQDDIIIGIWHRIPSYDDWIKSKESPVTHSAQLPISSQSEIDNFFDTSQQLAQGANPARMEQFAHIIPGKSTLLDIIEIMEQSGIGSWAIESSKFGWRIEFPAENPLNVILVDVDLDYTVLCVAHCIQDPVKWVNNR